MSQRYVSLFNLNKKNKFKFLNLDLSNCRIDEIPDCDTVIHLGAKTDAAQSSKLKSEFLNNNLNATKNIINFCLK